MVFQEENFEKHDLEGVEVENKLISAYYPESNGKIEFFSCKGAKF